MGANWKVVNVCFVCNAKLERGRLEEGNTRPDEVRYLINNEHTLSFSGKLFNSQKLLRNYLKYDFIGERFKRFLIIFRGTRIYLIGSLFFHISLALFFFFLGLLAFFSSSVTPLRSFLVSLVISQFSSDIRPVSSTHNHFFT